MAGLPEKDGYYNHPSPGGYHIPDRVIDEALAKGKKQPLWYAGSLLRDVGFDLMVEPVPEGEGVSDALTGPLPVKRPRGHPEMNSTSH